MFYSRIYKNKQKDGLVVVSISKLFHLLDLSRESDEENLATQKSYINNFLPSEQYSFKYKETIKSENKEFDIASKQNEKEIKTEESFIKENDDKIKDIKDNNIINSNTKIESNKQPIKKMRSSNKIRQIQNKFKSRRKKIKHCDYFTNLIACLFLLLIFNNCILWIFCYMASVQKNETYCYNHHLREFEICSKYDFCPSSGIHDFLYINDDSISNIDMKKELDNINNKFLNFYNYESEIFSIINKKFIKNENTLSKYSITIFLTKNEKYLFNNTFRVGCESYLLGMLIIIAISSIIGTFIFGLLADIFGRKNILICTIIIELIGGFSLFIETFYIQKYDSEVIFKNKFNNELINFFSLNFNETISFNNDYISNYVYIKNEILKTKTINDNFQSFNILIFFSVFFIFFSNSSVKIISLSYMLENALTEEKTMLYYLLFSLSQPISILLSTIMIIYLNSFEYPILICSIIIFIIGILITIFFFDSQRFNFEYCYYTKITEFVEYILGKEVLLKYYKVKDEEMKNNIESILNERENKNVFGILYSSDDYRVQSELNNEKVNQNTSILDAFKYTKFQFYSKLYSNNIIKQYKSNNLIERFIIYKEPSYIFKFIFKERHIKRKLNIILAFIINLSLVINLPLQRITNNNLFQREKLITGNVFISYLFLCIILVLIILFPFVHYLTKCFGIYVILFPFLILIIIGTFIFELICLSISHDGIIDLTISNELNNDQLIEERNKYLLPEVYIIVISLTCLDYIFYFVLIRLSKTIYRCSILAIGQIIYNLSFIIGIGIEKNIRGCYYYAGIFSLITLINSFFINYSEDSLNITDIREIKYDKNNNNDK